MPIAKPARTVPAEVPFVVTVGVSDSRYVSDCARVLSVLKRAGFEAGATKHETFDMIAADHDALPQLREIHTSGEEDE